MLDWRSVPIEARFVTGAYVFSPAHLTTLDIPADAEPVVALAPLTAKTYDRGVLGAAPVPWAPIRRPPVGMYEAVVFSRADTGRLIWFGSEGYVIPFREAPRGAVLYPDAAFGGFFRL